MLIVFSPIFMADTTIVCLYNSVAPLNVNLVRKNHTIIYFWGDLYFDFKNSIFILYFLYFIKLKFLM